MTQSASTPTPRNTRHDLGGTGASRELMETTQRVDKVTSTMDIPTIILSLIGHIPGCNTGPIKSVILFHTSKANHEAVRTFISEILGKH